MMNADGYEVSLVKDDADDHCQEEQPSRPHLAARTSMEYDQEDDMQEVTRDASHAPTTQTLKLAPAHLMGGKKALVDDGAQEAELVEKHGIKKDLKLQAIQQQALQEALEEEKKDDSSSGHLLVEPSSSSSVPEDVEVQLKDVPPRIKTKTDAETRSHPLPKKDLEEISVVTNPESSRLREDVPSAPSLLDEESLTLDEAPPPPPLSSAASPNLQQSLQLVAAESAGTSATNYSDGAPTMVGVGIPQPPQRTLTRPPSTRSICRGEEAEESKEEIVGPSRHKTTDELTQEAVDASLAENQAINAQNDKDGKKFLPDVDPTAIVRRQSSRMSCLSIDKCNMSYQTSAEFSVDGSSRRLDSSSHHSMRHRGHSPTPNSHNSSSSDRSPAYGSRSRQGLFEDDDDPELTAYAATALPGAYSMPGFGLEADSSTAEQASTIVNEAFYDETEQLTPAPPTGPLIQESVLVTTRHQEEALYVEGENVTEGLTDEQRIIAKRRFIKTQVFYGVCMMLIAIMISTIVVLTKRDPGPPTEDIVWVPVGEEASGPGVDDDLSFGFSVSLSGDGRRFCAGMPGYDASETQSDVGQVQIFDLSDDNEEWLPSATIDFGFEGRAGEAVALSKNGRRVVVGSPGWSDELGLLSVFEDDGDNTWFQIGGEIRGLQSDGDARLGTSVDISADGHVVAGAAPFSIDGGVVQVYEEVNSVWVRTGAAIAATTTQSLFGSSISLSSDGQRIAIGARNVGMGEGQVSVYDFNGTHWNQAGQTLNGSTDFESFGYAVSLNGAGDTLAVGAIGSPGQDSGFNSGKVQVFEYISSAASWSQVGDDILGRRSESLGSSVSLSDNGILAIGSPQRPQVQETGKVGVYSFTTSKGWTRVENEILGSLESESFGSSVSISSDGNIVAVGAPDADYDGRLNQVGKVRVFNNTNAPDPTTAMWKE